MWDQLDNQHAQFKHGGKKHRIVLMHVRLKIQFESNSLHAHTRLPEKLTEGYRQGLSVDCFDFVKILGDLSTTTSTPRWRIDDYTQYGHRLILCAPTDGVLRPNFQYGRCLLVIE